MFGLNCVVKHTICVENVNIHKSIDGNTVKTPKILKVTSSDKKHNSLRTLSGNLK